MLLLLGWICRGAVLVVFAVAVFGKVRDRSAFVEFRHSVAELSGVDRRWAGVVAVGVVAAETAVVLGLPAGRTAPWALGLAAVLLAAFNVALWRGLRAGVPVSCRCFGASSGPAGALPLVRNTLLLALVGGGLAAVLAGGAGLPPPAGLPVCAVGAVLAAVVPMRLEQLVDVFTARL